MSLLVSRNKAPEQEMYAFFAANPLAFFKRELKIITKAGGALSPLEINYAQRYVHQRLEKQKRVTGKVRALLLKGRQQGMSTYTEARFFHQNIFLSGRNTIIMAHLSTASASIYKMVRRFYDSLSDPFKPSLGSSSWQTLEFIKHKNIYQVLTAGSGDAGRGSTTHSLHGSEVAMWENAQDIVAGVMQSVSSEPGTEIILESTGKAATWYHDFWNKAVAGETEYLPIFVPWFWQPEYAVADCHMPKDFELTEEEAELGNLWGLSSNQLMWRREKVAVLGQDLFKQEYPFNHEEAFSAVDGDPFIPTEAINRAIKHRVHEAVGAIILGVDVARFGSDLTAMVWRKGRKVIKIETMRKASTAAVAERVKQILENQHDAPVPQKVFIDTGGVGGGVYDILVELKLSESDAARVSAVDFSRKAFNHIKYDIRRNELWGNMRHWFMQDDVTVDIPSHSLLIQSLMAPRKKYNKDNKLCVESKDEMIKRGVSSPDCGDALALTFAEPVFGNELETYGSAIENGPMFAPERAKALIL